MNLICINPHLTSIFFQFVKAVPGVPKIKDGYNPATWMLEVTTGAQEEALRVDFSQLYKNSELYKWETILSWFKPFYSLLFVVNLWFISKILIIIVYIIYTYKNKTGVFSFLKYKFLCIAGETRLWSRILVSRPLDRVTYTSRLSTRKLSSHNAWLVYGNNTCHTGEILLTLPFASSSPSFVRFCWGQYSGSSAKKRTELLSYHVLYACQ